MNQTLAYLESLFTNPQSARATVIASVLGGIISWRWLDDMNVRQKLFSLICGSIMADYIAPVIVDTFSNGKYIGFVALMIGLFGMSIVGKVFKMLKDTKTKDILDMIERLVGKLIDKIPSKENV